METLLTALYVKIDDRIGARRRAGRPPRLSDSELVCLAVAQALLGHRSEARWLRHARKHLAGRLPYLPVQSGYNRRLRAALPLVKDVIRTVAADSDFWFDNHWITDATPVPCGMSRPTVQRSQLAGLAGYGYCASHSRFYWGLKLYLVCTPTGMPILWALATPKIGEREVLAAMLDRDAALITGRGRILLIADKGLASKDLEKALASETSTSASPPPQGRGHPSRRTDAQESPPAYGVDQRHPQRAARPGTTGGRTPEGVGVRVAQRLLAMAAAIWHNNKTAAPITRSLIAYDH